MQKFLVLLTLLILTGLGWFYLYAPVSQQLGLIDARYNPLLPTQSGIGSNKIVTLESNGEPYYLPGGSYKLQAPYPNQEITHFHATTWMGQKPYRFLNSTDLAQSKPYFTVLLIDRASSMDDNDLSNAQNAQYKQTQHDLGFIKTADKDGYTTEKFGNDLVSGSCFYKPKDADKPTCIMKSLYGNPGIAISFRTKNIIQDWRNIFSTINQEIKRCKKSPSFKTRIDHVLFPKRYSKPNLPHLCNW